MEVWVLLYASGYTSEACTELFFKEEDARARFLELVERDYNNDDLTTEEVLEYLKRGETYDSDGGGVEISPGEITWDGPDVYEKLCYYEQEIN